MNASTRGRHLKIDARCLNISLLNDKESLAEIIHDLIDVVKMKVLVPANMVQVELDESKATEHGGDDGGVTGVAVLNTSHVSIHTWPLTSRFAFDLYSCCEFDDQEVFDFLHDRLQITDARIDSVSRGTPEENSGVIWSRR